MKTTRNEIRKAFKSVGYRVSFVRNPLNDAIVRLSFGDDGLHFISTGDCVGADFYSKHHQAYELAVKFKGFFLTDTDQRIV